MSLNYWTEQSIILACEKNYLDLLFKVYPIPTRRDPREINELIWENIHTFHINKSYGDLLLELFKLEKFPFDNAYVGFLKEDHDAIGRNPETTNRIGSFLCDMPIKEIYDGVTAPKSTSRAIGPMFKNWLLTKPLGFDNYFEIKKFINCRNGILIGSDDFLKKFCKEYLGYSRDKGIDFVAKRNNCFIVGEVKFISAAGGTQDKSFKDILSCIDANWHSKLKGTIVTPIGILDGYPLLNKGHYKQDYIKHTDKTFVSTLLLRDYLYSL